ncbi:MAG: Arc family DNA-binding protein [Firmicutes bacterium]|nr:Arc family DNA-binding protein [Bacillota bacterium]
MPSDKRVFTLRLTDEDYEKIKILSATNNRSMANQIEYLVRRFIADHEKKHGLIKIE